MVDCLHKILLVLILFMHVNAKTYCYKIVCMIVQDIQVKLHLVLLHLIVMFLQVCSFITIGHWNPPCELIARVLLACVIISKITSGTLFLYSSCYLLHCKLIFTWWDFEVDLSHIMFQHSYFILCLIGSILSPYRESQFWFCSPLLFAGQGHMEVPLVCWPFILVIIVCKPVIFVIIKVRD